MPTAPHIIRLREPWRRERSGAAIELRRAFNCPTGLGEGEEVRLVVEKPPFVGQVSLNGKLLGPVSDGKTVEYDITRRLLPRNELVISVACNSDSAVAAANLEAPLEQVRLEIHEASSPI